LVASAWSLMRAGVGGVGFALDPSALLQQDEHRPHGAGVRRHAAGKFALREGFPTCEGREQNELIGGGAVRRELRVRPAVECQVRGAEGASKFVSGGHRRSRENSCVYARFESEMRLRRRARTYQ
jgi:hypothetical protein